MIASDDRTDMWREGKWLDLWSLVHLLSGVSIGFAIHFLDFGPLASILLVLLLLITYEMWEMLMRIKETSTNRFMDVVVGMAGFLPTFFLVTPSLPERTATSSFELILVINIVLSIFGWRASRKAAALKKRIHLRYTKERDTLLEQQARLKRKFRHKHK